MARLEWRQAEVIAAIVAEVAGDMETAAKMVEVDAKRRLLAIKDPERGLKYRRYLAQYKLTSMVVSDTQEVLGAIGVPPGREGSDYGFWIEVGSRTAPAHPWLRPAMLTNLKAILGCFEG